MKKIKLLAGKITKFLKPKFASLKVAFDEKPLLFFYGSLALLVLLIIIQNILSRPQKVKTEEKIQTKNVEVYKVGASPTLQFTGTIEKSGVVKIVALVGGVVQKINFREGANVKKGATIMRLTTNYQGGNLQETQRQLAQTQYKQVLDTYDSQKDIIAKQKEMANRADSQVANLRAITQSSISETENLISLSSQIISSLDTKLATYSLDPTANADLILATKQAKSQFVASQNMNNNALRQAKFQADSESDPNKMSILNRDIATRQLDIQSLVLDNQKELSRLQLSLAKISAGMMSPASPFGAQIQKIFVKEGEQVNPGSPLAIVSQIYDDPITLTVLVSREVSQKISKNVFAHISIRDAKIDLKPAFVSGDAVANGLYAIYFHLPDSFITKVTDQDSANVIFDLTANEKNTIYIPLDGVRQTSSSSFVFVEKNGVATAQKVELGDVIGTLVEVKNLNIDENVILDRNITDGIKIKVVSK